MVLVSPPFASDPLLAGLLLAVLLWLGEALALGVWDAEAEGDDEAEAEAEADALAGPLGEALGGAAAPLRSAATSSTVVPSLPLPQAEDRRSAPPAAAVTRVRRIRRGR
ncbi:hypothetical protein [Streptomyces nymphaeiformis]|uniref:Uncharacterized protein n=1 Tax=Streptomyces nymphaeiformis TaxID=2663842 RepID=A0A7W7TYX5_9ACTN|nr:hypothetical protein [Streptomyces nymphaeiformis]MBB4981521.1 hypothetical protein [Streptomyces nymphaeiformis]